MSVAALVLLTLVIPLAVGFVEAMGKSLIGTADAASEFTGLTVVEPTNPTYLAAVGYKHKDSGGNWEFDVQTPAYAAATGKNYTSVIVSTGDVTQNAQRSTTLWWNLNVTPAWLLSHSVDAVRVDMNVSSAKSLLWWLAVSGTNQAGGGSADNRTGVRCDVAGIHRLSVDRYRVTGRDGVATPNAEIDTVTKASSGLIWNVTNGGTAKVFRTMELHIAVGTLIMFDQYCGGADVNKSSFALVVGAKGNTDGTSIIAADEFQVSISFIASAVNRNAVIEIGIGTLGVTLVLGAAAASPAWNPGRYGPSR